MIFHENRLLADDSHVIGMIFHENRLLADDSPVISYLIFLENWERRPKIYHLLQS